MKVHSFITSLMMTFFTSSVFASGAVDGPFRNLDGTLDYSRSVEIGKSHVYSLNGYADAKKIQEKLRPYGYKVAQKFGKTLVSLAVSINDDFLGCGCPKAFNEFAVSYLIESTMNGSVHVAQDFMLVDHPVRLHSMALKFGTVEKLSKMIEVDMNQRVLVKDENNETLFYARPFNKFPKARFESPADFGLHSFGGHSEVLNSYLAPKFFRIQGPSKVGFSPYIPGLDIFVVNPESKLGRHLKEVNFRPAFWQVQNMKNGHAWITTLKP